MLQDPTSTDLLNAADPSLPLAIRDKLVPAQRVAQENVARLQSKHPVELSEIAGNIEKVQGPSVPRPQKIIRLRHLAQQLSGLAVKESACKQGCSHCCHVNVSVPRSEAELMAKRLRRPLNKKVLTHSVYTEAPFPGHTGKPCVFLKEGKCSIYEHRPFVCRTLVNMSNDPSLCEVSEHQKIPVPYLNTTRISGWFGVFAEKEDFADIRDWFA